jgi:ER membrane protein complex subunit 1
VKIKVTSIDLATGHKMDSYTITPDSDITSSAQIHSVHAHNGSPVIAWTDKSSKALKVNVLGASAVHSLAIDNESGQELDRVSLHAPQHPGAKPYFLAHYQTSTEHWADVFYIDPKSKLTKAYSLPRLAGRGAFTSNVVGTDVVRFT